MPPNAASCNCPSPASTRGCVSPSLRLRLSAKPKPTPTPTPTPNPNQGRREPRSCRPKRWRALPPSTSYRVAGVRVRPPPRQGQRWRRVAASTLGEGQRPHPQVCAARAGGSVTVTSPTTAHRTAPLTIRGRGHYTRRMALAATSSNSARRGAVGAQTATLSRSRKRRAVQPPPATGSLSAHRACSRRPLVGRATLHSSCASNGRPPGMITRT
eukprot:scaffold73189_cov59-Phaeocystis_antarctica.AAC.4